MRTSVSHTVGFESTRECYRNPGDATESETVSDRNIAITTCHTGGEGSRKKVWKRKLMSGGNALVTEVDAPSDSDPFGEEEMGNIAGGISRVGVLVIEGQGHSAPSGTRVCSSVNSTGGLKPEDSPKLYIAVRSADQGRSGFSQNMSARVRGLWCFLCCGSAVDCRATMTGRTAYHFDEWSTWTAGGLESHTTRHISPTLIRTPRIGSVSLMRCSTQKDPTSSPKSRNCPRIFHSHDTDIGNSQR